MAKSYNAQQQNQILKKEIRNSAVYWRNNPNEIPELVKTVLHEKQINLATCIITHLFDEEWYGVAAITGELMTDDYQVFWFDIGYDDFDTRRLISLVWEDITPFTNFSLHNKGIGKGKGALMKEVLNELNFQAA